MSDPVALVLAQHEVAREVGALGVVHEQVAQQQRSALDVASRSLPEVRRPRRLAGPVQQGHPKPTLVRARSRLRHSVHRSFTRGSQAGNERPRPRRDADPRWKRWSAHTTTFCTSARWRSGPTDGLVLAGGRALNLSVREFGLLVALARSGGGIVRREDLYARVWGGALRGGDRSIDVYIHKLRVKLEEALPDWRVHPHPRGLRLPLLAGAFTRFSHPGHGSVTGCCRVPARACRAQPCNEAHEECSSVRRTDGSPVQRRPCSRSASPRAVAATTAARAHPARREPRRRSAARSRRGLDARRADLPAVGIDLKDQGITRQLPARRLGCRRDGVGSRVRRTSPAATRRSATTRSPRPQEGRRPSTSRPSSAGSPSRTTCRA